MRGARLVIHGHFYQPPRENPWTEEVAAEPSAAPFHDWNERVTAECYRPNGWARVLDDRGQVTDIVDNYAHLSFDVGPTLLSWLERHAPDVYQRILDGDRAGGGGIAQGYNHAILPLCNDRDLRTQVRWGLADFAHRFGRPAEGMWLPEAAVDARVLAVLAEEGVAFTILAPSQAATPVQGGHPYRWQHPDRPDLGVTIVFYDGAISHDLAFSLTGMSSQELVRRVLEAGRDGAPVCVATDGETFGHHHKFTERAIAYAFTHEAPAAGVEVVTASAVVRSEAPVGTVEVRESSWSCAHGVGRWREDCGCSTGGEPGWNQRWRAPLRAALDVVRDAAAAAFEHRGREVLRDPWAARDAYVDVLLGRTTREAFLAEHGKGDPGGDDGVVAATLLEAQRHALLMYTSCGWFFNDLAGIETLQVLRYAARCIDLLVELGEPDPTPAVLDVLGQAASNQSDEGDGRAVWARHVVPTRVDPGRVAAHLALVELLEHGRAGTGPGQQLAGYTVERHDCEHRGRPGLSGVAGTVTIVHGRTGRRTALAYAAVRLAELEVFGAVRPADAGRDGAVFEQLRRAVDDGARVTSLLRLVAEGFGPREFSLESALPDAADQILRGAADALVERFTAAYQALYDTHRNQLASLLLAGYPLPPELRVAVELALGRRLEAELGRFGDDGDDGALRAARRTVDEARAAGLQLASPRAAALLSRTLLAAIDRAVAERSDASVDAALHLLRLVRELGVGVDLGPPQEAVWPALQDGNGALARLGSALRLRPRPS